MKNRGVKQTGIKRGLKQLRKLGEEGYHYSIKYDARIMSRCYVVEIRHVFGTVPKTFIGKTMIEAVQMAVKSINKR